MTSTPELEKETLAEVPARTRTAAAAGVDTARDAQLKPPPPLEPRSSSRLRPGGDQPVPHLLDRRERSSSKPRSEVPFPVLYPSLQTGPAEQQQVRAYTLKDQQGIRHHAYVIVWQQNAIGGYYDFEGTDWLNPPLFAHARTQLIDGRTYEFVNDGSHIHVIGWRSGQRAVLGHEHAARGIVELADARDREIGAAAALSQPLAGSPARET